MIPPRRAIRAVIHPGLAFGLSTSHTKLTSHTWPTSRTSHTSHTWLIEHVPAADRDILRDSRCAWNGLHPGLLPSLVQRGQRGLQVRQRFSDRLSLRPAPRPHPNPGPRTH
jgi:hypothetical protein